MAEEEKIEATAPESNTEEFIDDDGLKHVVVRDAEGKPLSDQAFDKDGNLRGEGIYKDGEFIEEQKYNDVPAVRGQEMPARTQETQQEQPDLHPVRVEQTAEQEQPDLHPVRVEQTAETVNTVLPAVRGNEMPERAQEPVVLEGQEANLAQSLGNYAQKPSKESFEAFAFDLQHVVADYVGSGMTPAAATQKASELLGQLYDRAESQNLDPQILANLRNAKEAANKFMAQEVEKLNAAPTMLNEVNAGRQDENIEDVEFEEILAAPVAENEGNESDDTPAAPANINEGNESDDTPAAPANINEGNESDDAPAAPANTNDENVGLLRFGNTAETENINTDIDINKTDDLLEQMMNTAFKNRYMMLEDVENDSSHLCPFRQFKTSTLKDNSGDKKNPYVRMDLESGARVYNRPGQIDVHYDTKEGEDPHVSFDDALALVRLGQEKGWTSANLEGPKEYKEQMFLAMYTLGMKVHGDFIPSEELLKKAEEMRKKYLADAKHAASIDQRFGAIEEKRKAAGIEKPEDVGKEFIDDMKKQGLGYDAKIESITRTVTHHKQILDDDGKPTAEEVYDSDGKKIESKTFDKNGNYQGEKYDKDGEVILKTEGVHVYDPDLKQNIFMENVFDLDGKIISHQNTYPDGSKYQTGISSKDLYLDVDGKEITDFENNTSIAVKKYHQWEKSNKIKEYSNDLKKISGVDWEFKDAENSALKQNNLRTPYSEEQQKKLDEAGIRYELGTKGDQKLLIVFTDKPLYLTEEEKAKKEQESHTSETPVATVKEYSEKLKEISSVDWEFKNAKDSALKINNLRAPDSEELRKKLDAAGIRYEEAVKGDQKLLTVNTDKPLYLTEKEAQGQKTVQQPQTALVPVTPEIQNKMDAVAQASTTALAKTDPARAQQASAQIAATPGIANQLQLAGRTANEAKGNDVKAAQQQHQQETALVLAARNNNRTK